MSRSYVVPADSDALSLQDLIHDAEQVSLPRRDNVDLLRLPTQLTALRIPESSVGLLDGVAEYGSC